EGSLLNLIVVTASRTAEALREVSSNMTIITSEEIDNSSARTLDDLLLQKGFKITKYPGGSLSTIQIRGFSTDSHGNDLGSHILILRNGRRIATGNSSMITLNNIDRIEIIRGPAVVQYGSSAMGGVVNIITKQGVGQPFKTRISLDGGSFDSINASADFTGSYQNFDFSTGFRFDSQKNIKAGEGIDIFNSDYKTYAASVGVGYTFNDVHRVGIDFSYFINPDGGSPGSVTQDDTELTSRIKKSNLSIALDYAGSTSDKMFSWKGLYSFARDYREFWNTRGFPVTADFYYDVKSNFLQGQFTYNGSIFELTGGVDYLHYDMFSSPYASAAHDSIYSDIAGFAIGKLKLLQDKLIISIGGRYDSFTLESKDLGTSKDSTNFAPSIGVVFLPFDFLKIRAHYAEAFSMPTESQLGGNFDSGFGYYVGNPNLTPETSDTYEVGFDIVGNHANIGLTYFWIKTKDFIDFYTTTEIGPDDNYITTYRNNDLAYRNGIELSAAIDLGSLFDQDYVLKPSFNMTHFFTAKTRDLPTNNWGPIRTVAMTAISTGLYFNHSEYNFMANLSVNRFIKQYNSRNYTPTSTTVPTSYTVVDLVVQKGIYQFKDSSKLSARLSVSNFTDELYKTNYTHGYWMPGRSIHVGLIYEY
ncbi:MAG: TonB-dependent receptor, partial [Rickettsiales bacterium]|nr:TonB-dependent receptor [Rickettsiales bacterium]